MNDMVRWGWATICLAGVVALLDALSVLPQGFILVIILVVVGGTLLFVGERR